jgi:hypothetical protein
MSFGFGVGDFIAVFELVNKIKKEFDGAPDQFNDISYRYVNRNREENNTNSLLSLELVASRSSSQVFKEQYWRENLTPRSKQN